MKSKEIYERINTADDDHLIIDGYMRSHLRFILFIILVIITCGFILILIGWKSPRRVRITHSKCSLDQASAVIIKDCFDREYVESVVKAVPGLTNTGNCVHFFHQKIKYIWRAEMNQFMKLKGLESYKCGVIYSMIEGLTTNEALLRSQLYGLNTVLVEIKPIWRLIIDEITEPFYIYQMFIFTIWMIQLYYQFSICVLILSMFSVSLHVWQTRKQLTALYNKVHSESEISVIRDEHVVKLASRYLVPGDVITLSADSHRLAMECDAVLMSGTCIVDESSLTGESVPISKVALTDDQNTLYLPKTHSINTLYAGTRVLNVLSGDHNYVKAIVVRTGFFTTKGKLVRSILFPKPTHLQLKRDLIKCMAIFFMLGIPCMAYTAYRFANYKTNIWDIAIIVLDVATFLVPPLLPAVITSINAHSQRRLRRKGVYCLDPNAINSCGSVDVVCFDKTGTLTDDSIELSGVLPVDDQSFGEPIRDVTTLSTDNKLLLSLGCCHSLSQNEQGDIEGESIDMKLFEHCQWRFKKGQVVDDKLIFGNKPERIVGPDNGHGDINIMFGIVRQFPFESINRRQTVVIKRAYDQSYIVLMKGAPEVVVSYCTPDTVPEDYSGALESHTRVGLRVLSAASKEFIADLDTLLKMNRDELESDMDYDGFIVIQNRVKPETISVLRGLRDANIRSVMATGDNLLTSISVGRECGLIDESDSVIKVEAELFESVMGNQALRVFYGYVKLPGFSEKLNMKWTGGTEIDDTLLPVQGTESGRHHLALEGDVYELIRQNDRKLLNQVVHKGTIFARMSPELKLSLVEVLQQQGHQVGMCGDGANDCGALRTANAGISLSGDEASVASPFAYRDKNISCVPTLISEGRANLSATIGAFKYQVCYGFVLLGAVLILFWEGNKPSDGTYVFVDIILNILPPVVFGATRAYPMIVRQQPTATVLTFLPQLSMYSFIVFQFLLYLAIRQLTVSQVWYEPFVFEVSQTHSPKPSHISLAIFSVNMISYVIAAIIFNPGPPYRTDIFSNKWYLLVVLINFALVACVILFPPQFLLTFLNFKEIPYHFKLILFMISIANFILCYVWEMVVLQGIVFNWLLPKLRSTRAPVRLFEKIELEMRDNNSWPPIVTSQRFDYSAKHDRQASILKRRMAAKERLLTNAIVMRTISNDDELNSRYVPSIMAQTSLESPVAHSRTSYQMTFSTFSPSNNRNHRVSIEPEHDSSL